MAKPGPKPTIKNYRDMHLRIDKATYRWFRRHAYRNERTIQSEMRRVLRAYIAHFDYNKGKKA